MAHYTILSDEDLDAILIHYSIDKVQSYYALGGGSENTNYRINTSTKTYILTICEQKSQEKSRELATLLEHLKQHNFETSKLVKTTNGAMITMSHEKPIMLKDYIKGEIIEDLTEDLLMDLGKQLAKLHQIEAPDYLPQTVSYGIERFDEVLVYAPDSSFYVWLKEMQTYIESNLNSDLPKALIHSDIFYNNIIVDDDGERATIMDFEEACYYYRVFDIGMMIIGCCSEGEIVNLNKVSWLLQGYQQETKLLVKEIDALQAAVVYGAVATAFWRHQNFNYVKYDAAMTEHYLAMKLLADFVKRIDPKQFKEGIKHSTKY